MVEGSWLDMTLPIEKELILESHRRDAVRMKLHELQAVHDTLLVSYCHLGHMLNQAMCRVAELEAKDALVEDKHLQLARELLGPDAPAC